MRRIRLKPDPDPEDVGDAVRYPADTRRVVRALAAAGYRAGPALAAALWAAYSDSLCAGWLSLPAADADIVRHIRPYFEEDE